ncbi:hypothetical protein, partial [Paraburkholderia hospita]|uniref:hypothetical protein n=1 Tax=Paraburkholderia hospita TaxID=169430 RepID=UPI001A988A78
MRGHRFVHGDWQQTKGELPRNAGVTVRVGRDSKLRVVRAGWRKRVVQQGAGRHGVVSPIFVPLRAPRFCAGDEAVFLAGVGLLNRIVGRFFEIHQHMSATSICWERAKS